MTGTELIDRYVADVVRLLPRRQRRDVAIELRELLSEEVGEGDARELLRRFGHPTEVAARYGQPVALIDPVDTRRFLTLAIGGTVVLHAAAYLNDLITPSGNAAETAWPLVFGWLGLLFVGFALLAWRRRRRASAPEWKPAPAPSDRVNRVGRSAGIVFFVAGTATLVTLDSGPFARDAEFLRVRGPIVLALLISGIVLQILVVAAGRWRQGLRTADAVHSVVTCGVLTWVIGSGPVFTAVPTDQTAKAACAIVVLVSLIDLVVRSHRLSVASALRP
ncbi:HAAS signaling domain-containing protein [Cryptosporangium arvum]|uniref:HAAS signaling domain-containing protein n=1 Tax=Cryptosporangium arvum TaxID=80871 RepID=UPI0004ADCFE5|nr:hypothetical protein [Cryptosporangium arvum]